MTATCPISTPTLKAASAVARWSPANCSDSRSAKAKPKPCTSPKAKAAIQRRPALAPKTFSIASHRIDAAISSSTSGGNHSASGAKPLADAISVIECATVNDVTIAMSARIRRKGITRHNTNSR